jgi:LysR family transcriptional regulator, glycine cleavage system transcriptional activator
MNMHDLPLNALRALAAIHETGGIRAAARVLKVNPSAVHRQLRELELRLGVPLTSTEGTLEFTYQGEQLARRASEALAILAAGVETTREDRRANAILLATSDSFASRWLIPRLPLLRKAHPRIDLSIVTGQRAVDVPREANLAIRMGAGPWPGAQCEPLMDEEIFPVIAPNLWTSVGQPASVTEVLHLPRIHDRDPQTSWREWGAVHGIANAKLREGTRITSTDLALSVAALELGVALARGRLATGAIENGTLMAFPERMNVSLGPAYWLVRPPHLRTVEKDFIHWLRAECSAE